MALYSCWAVELATGISIEVLEVQHNFITEEEVCLVNSAVHYRVCETLTLNDKTVKYPVVLEGKGKVDMAVYQLSYI